MHLPSLIYAPMTPFAQGVIRHLVLGFLPSYSFPTPLIYPLLLQPFVLLRLTLHKITLSLHSIALAILSLGKPP
jgi:hypothetical protein